MIGVGQKYVRTQQRKLFFTEILHSRFGRYGHEKRRGDLSVVGRESAGARSAVRAFVIDGEFHAL